MEVLHGVDQMFRQWLSMLRLFGARVAGEELAAARPASPRARRPSLPRMSSEWLLEHELASVKRGRDA